MSVKRGVRCISSPDSQRHGYCGKFTGIESDIGLCVFAVCASLVGSPAFPFNALAVAALLNNSRCPFVLRLFVAARNQRGRNKLSSLRSPIKMIRTLRFMFAAFVLVALCVTGTMTQSTTTGAINGTVTNPNKEVVAGATVTVKNNGTNK